MDSRETKIMRKKNFWLVPIFAALVSAALPAMAQPQPAKIHGHVQDPAGTALKGGTVSLSEDGGKTNKYTFKTDDNGNYTGDGIAPGTYAFIYRNADTPPDKVVDEFSDVKIAAGADLTQDFDMSRTEYLAKLTPE